MKINKSLVIGLSIGMISMFLTAGCTESEASSKKEPKTNGSINMSERIKLEFLSEDLDLITDRDTGVQYLVYRSGYGVAMQPLIGNGGGPITVKERQDFYNK